MYRGDSYARCGPYSTMGVPQNIPPDSTKLVVADASRLEKRFVLPRNPIANYATKLQLYIRGGKDSKSQEFFVPLQVEF